ncbi:MAG: PolC-type DNA polymerase III [Bacteriovoracaceae bacterium]
MKSRYVICDIEATGLDLESEIIEIALITFQDDQVVDVYETLINPLRPVSEYITKLTSITNRELQSSPKFYEVAEAIKIRLSNAVFVSHNTEFDLGILRRKFQELGQELKLKSFCTLKVAQQEIPGLKNYNLDALCSFFNIKVKQRHRALGDAKATLELFKELLDLHFKVRPKLLFIPDHQKQISKIPLKAGLLVLKNSDNQIIHLESCFNLNQKAKELLQIKEENRALIEGTNQIEFELTGSALIAEFRKLEIRPIKLHWMITVKENVFKEKYFEIRALKKHDQGLWYFTTFKDAQKKLKSLKSELKSQSYAYREVAKSKEEIFQHNKKVELLSKHAAFPYQNILIVGEGRAMGEKSFILVRRGHVLGYGHSFNSEQELIDNPEAYLNQRFSKKIAIDLAAKRHLQVIKNLKAKTENWRAISER